MNTKRLVIIMILIGAWSGLWADTIPIRLDSVNPHYFNFRGEPTVLITSAEQYSSVQNLAFDYDPYLDELEEHGMNYTRIFCGVYVNGIADSLPRMNDGRVFMPIGAPLYPDTINAELTEGLCSPWARSDSAGYFVGGNKFDLDTWDTLYFSRLHDFVQKAGSKGIVVEVTFFCGYGGKQYWWYSPMNTINNINGVGKFGGDYGPYDDEGNNIGHKFPLTLQAAEEDGLLEYQEAMVAKHLWELRNYDNIFIEICNEPYYVDATYPDTLENNEICGTRVGVSTQWLAHMTKFAIDVMDTLPHKFLIAQNIDHNWEIVSVVNDTVSPVNMTDFRKIYSEVDILHFHYGANSEFYIDYAMERNYKLNRVISMDENGYLSNEDQHYRKQAWNYIVGGGGIFNNSDLSYTTNGYEGGQPTNPSEGYGGSPELHEQIGILKEFIHTTDFLAMTKNNFLPKANGIITDLSAKPDTAFIRCLSNEGVEYVVFVEGGTEVSITFDLPEGNYKAEWINTKARDTSGQIVIDKTEFIYHDGDTVTLTSPEYTEEDIALHITSFIPELPVVDTAARADEDTIPLIGNSQLKVDAHDPNGEPLNYLWTKTSGPDTVYFSLNDTTTSDRTVASFGAAGTYVLTVSIYDGKDTITQDVTILVRPRHFQNVWTGDAYQPMTLVFDTAIFNGQPLTLGDEVGIFDTSELGNPICVGTAMVATPVSATDSLVIIASADNPAREQNGFIEGNAILAKIWHYTQQEEIDSVINTFDGAYDTVFVTNGHAKASLSSTNYFGQLIPLSAGWNIESFGVIPDSINMIQIHASLIDSGKLIKVLDEDGGFLQQFGGTWFNLINNNTGLHEPTEGYYIKVNDTANLMVEGMPVATPFTISLFQGWNIISYPLTESQSAMDIVQELADNNILIKMLDEGGGFIQKFGNTWFDFIGNLQPTEGYYVKVNADATITLNYPPNGPLMQEILLPKTKLIQSPFSNNPYLPMNILVRNIEISGFTPSAGDEIGVYDNGLLVGTGIVTLDGDFAANIVTMQDDPTTEIIDGYTEGNAIILRYFTPGNPEPDELLIRPVFGQPLFSSLGTFVCDVSKSLSSTYEYSSWDIDLDCYPTPASDRLTIAYSVPEGRVETSIYDIRGQLVEKVFDEDTKPGSYDKIYNTGSLQEGLYLLTMSVHAKNGTFLRTIKFVIQR